MVTSCNNFFFQLLHVCIFHGSLCTIFFIALSCAGYFFGTVIAHLPIKHIMIHPYIIDMGYCGRLHSMGLGEGGGGSGGSGRRKLFLTLFFTHLIGNKTQQLHKG